MPVVLVNAPNLYRQEWEFMRAFRDAGLEIRFPTPGGRQLTLPQLLENLPGVDFCLAGSEPWKAEVFEKFPNVRVVARCGVGYDTVDMKAATAAGVAVGYTPGANHEAVAEQTFLLLLGLTKQVLENHRLVAAVDFKRRCMVPLRGKTLGIIGLGRIGKAVAERSRVFGMTTLACDPFIDASKVDPGLAKMVDLDTLLAQSDFISIHTPLTAETRNLIDANAIAKMKDGVYIINTARGGVIKEVHLAAALASGKVAGAGLDVFADEPPVASPMLDAPNCLFSPHVAGIDQAAIEAMGLSAATTIVDLYQGRWPAERIVNQAELKNWKWDAKR